MDTGRVVSRDRQFLQSRWLWYLLGDSPDMTWVRFLRPVFYGLLLTVAQIAMAVFFIAPEGPIPDQYRTLIQADSYWFMNIVDRGYQTIVPPIDHKVMEVSNVGFFPAYPAIASVLHYVLGLETHESLLITAQAAAWGFWSYFFLFCERWNLSPALRFFGALSIVAHPAAFFLVAAYSESLFLMALIGFIYWSGENGRMAKLWAALHGIVMSATRLVGISCTAFPVVQRVLEKGWNGLRAPRDWFRNYGGALALMGASILGAGIFFLYCQVRWGNWNIYMATQSLCWGIDPDYLAVFKISNYRWLIPALNDPTEVSQMAMTLGGLFLLCIVLCEFLPGVRRRVGWPMRIGIYFCAATIYYISVSGVASVEMESMLRYEFCVHALIVLAFLHFLHQFRTFPVPLRTLGMVTVALGGAAGLSLQGWCLWNFTRGNWVA
ncbi:MAG TPA: hypothetical protein VEI58_09825 [Chthoniobacterales bacterium]|nr:hypothetical protein [Chthoniobacterales bacterium]